jgi:ABC-type lipoprotein release transport system permease subunit
MLGSFIIIIFAFLGAAAGGILVMYLNFPNGEVQMMKSELKKTIPYYDIANQVKFVLVFTYFRRP